MKTMKVALLATAALAAVSVSARASESDTAAIKAQLEALTARIAQLEASPAVPVGYSLLTMTEIEPLTLTGEKASDRSAIKSSNRISILPTADMPAESTIDWDIEIRAALTYSTNNKSVTTEQTQTIAGAGTTFSPYFIDTNTFTNTTYSDNIQVKARGRLRVKATTETSVGTVGVDMRLQGASEFGGGAAVVMNIAWGWWQMTPEWTLGGGYTGTLSDPGHGMDSLATFGTTIYFGHGDQEQMRLTYASGPLTWAVALEDGDHTSGETQLAVASRLNWAGDAFSASLSGYYEPLSGESDYWQVAAGATFGLGDMANLSVNGAFNADDEFGATAYISFGLTDTTSFEVSGGHIWTDSDGGYWTCDDTLGCSGDKTKVNAGIYWAPVDQLKIGVQADHIWNEDDRDQTSASLVTWYTF